IDGRLGDTTVIHVGATDTVKIEVTNLLQLWAADSTHPTAILLRAQAEAQFLGEIRFYPSIAPAFRPTLQVTFVRAFPFGESWDVWTRDSVLLRDVLQRYIDELTSDGSVADVRLAVASRLSRRIAIGAGVHVLAGSTRMTAERRFDDSTFHSVQQSAEVRYDGFGASGSVLLGLAPGLTLAGWARRDSRLRA